MSQSYTGKWLYPDAGTDQRIVFIETIAYVIPVHL